VDRWILTVLFFLLVGIAGLYMWLATLYGESSRTPRFLPVLESTQGRADVFVGSAVLAWYLLAYVPPAMV
jgi:nicotinamide riboside transporter PnuC